MYVDELDQLYSVKPEGIRLRDHRMGRPVSARPMTSR